MFMTSKNKSSFDNKQPAQVTADLIDAEINFVSADSFKERQDSIHRYAARIATYTREEFKRLEQRVSSMEIVRSEARQEDERVAFAKMKECVKVESAVRKNAGFPREPMVVGASPFVPRFEILSFD